VRTERLAYLPNCMSLLRNKRKFGQVIWKKQKYFGYTNRRENKKGGEYDKRRKKIGAARARTCAGRMRGDALESLHEKGFHNKFNHPEVREATKRESCFRRSLGEPELSPEGRRSEGRLNAERETANTSIGIL